MFKTVLYKDQFPLQGGSNTSSNFAVVLSCFAEAAFAIHLQSTQSCNWSQGSFCDVHGGSKEHLVHEVDPSILTAYFDFVQEAHNRRESAQEAAEHRRVIEQ